MVEDIKKLGTKLDAERLGDHGHLGVFEERHIKLGDVRAVESVPTGKKHWLGARKARLLK